MKKLSVLSIVVAALAMTACDSDSNNGFAQPPPPPPPPVDTFKLQVLHASPDAPAVNVLVDGVETISNADYKAGSPALDLEVGSYDIQVDGITPGGPVTVVPSTNLPFAVDTLYTVVAVGDVASLAPLIVEQPADAVDAGNAQVTILHAAPDAPPVNVYATLPGADLTMSTAIGEDTMTEDIAFMDSLAPTQVPAGEYQVRVTLADDPTALVFDAGNITLADGDDLFVAAVENTGTGASPISLVVLTQSGSFEIFDVGTPAEVRVVHASPNAPPVDVAANDDFVMPLVDNLAFPAATDYLEVAPDTYNIKVAPDSDNTMVVIDENLDFDVSERYTVVAYDNLATIAALSAGDDTRRVATEAKLRLIHASPTAMDVDIWVTPVADIADPDTDITAVDPDLEDIPLGANTGFISLTPGIYDVNVAQAGLTTAAINVRITVAAGGIYTAIARDAEGGAGGLPLGLILLDDFTI